VPEIVFLPGMRIILANLYPGGPQGQTASHHGQPAGGALFGFIGFRDIRTICIQGTLQNGPEQVEEDTAKAMAEASHAAMEFAGEVAMRV
jgi:FMN-dependent NADH-azoreductase